MKISNILSGLFFLIACTTLSGCMKDVYKGEKTDPKVEPKPNPTVPDKDIEKLPDLSVSTVFDWNEVYVKIPLSGTTDINDIQILFPPLKFNKSFAYSYTFDDNIAQAYGKAFCTINKKWVDDMKFFHVGQSYTTGRVPAKSLGYTDGCGNERRFTFGVSVWPDSKNIHIDNFMNPTNKKADKYYPYLVWRDVIPLLDYGCDIYFHDVNTDTYGDDVTGILAGMKAIQEITKKNIGRKMKILARPNGDNKYCTAARDYNDIVMMAVENGTDEGPAEHISFNVSWDLRNVAQYRRYTEPTPSVDQLMPEIDKAALSGSYTWLHDFSHGPANFQYILDLFTEINNKYGKDGNDCVWFATLDEIYEYNYLRNNCIITKEISNNTLTLRFYCPSSDLPNEFMFHRDFSVIVKGVSPQPNANIATGNNVYSLSYAKQGDNSWMFNIDCNKSLLDKAERYTSAYEKERSASAKEDALYFVNRLKDSLRKPFENRIK